MLAAMTTKFAALVFAIGLASACVVQAQSPTPGESPAQSASPAKQRTHKKAKTTSSAQTAASPATSASPAASPKAKRVSKKKEAATAASPAASALNSTSAIYSNRKLLLQQPVPRPPTQRPRERRALRLQSRLRQAAATVSSGSIQTAMFTTRKARVFTARRKKVNT